MMNSTDTLSSEFKKEWDRVGVYHAKGFVKNPPSWEEVLNILPLVQKQMDIINHNNDVMLQIQAKLNGE